MRHLSTNAFPRRDTASPPPSFEHPDEHPYPVYPSPVLYAPKLTNDSPRSSFLNGDTFIDPQLRDEHAPLAAHTRASPGISATCQRINARQSTGGSIEQTLHGYLQTVPEMIASLEPLNRPGSVSIVSHKAEGQSKELAMKQDQTPPATGAIPRQLQRAKRKLSTLVETITSKRACRHPSKSLSFMHNDKMPKEPEDVYQLRIFLQKWLRDNVDIADPTFHDCKRTPFGVFKETDHVFLACLKRGKIKSEYKCHANDDYCNGWSSKRLDKALDHIRAHFRHEPYACATTGNPDSPCSTTCKERFSSRNDLTTHQTRKQAGPVGCHFCSKEMSLRNLKRHEEQCKSNPRRPAKPNKKK